MSGRMAGMVEVRERLLLPGPVLMPSQVYRALGEPIVNHRGPALQACLQELTEGLGWLFQTAGRVLIFTASGTGALESVVANCFNSGDPVVVATAGSFGERWAGIARAFRLDVHLYEQPWGQALDPERLAAFATERPDAKAVLVTHSETSTGTVHDLESIAAALAGHPALLAVDAVSSAGAVPFRMDEWGVDIALSGSQKALASTPGLSFVAVGERAWSRRGELPRYYFDWDLAATFAERRQTPWTPAIHVIFATLEALRLLQEEGLESAWERHRKLGAAVRAGVQALGLRLFSRAAGRSNTVTAVELPGHVDATVLLGEIRRRTGIVFAGGQGPLAGKVLRFGHLGRLGAEDVLAGLAALEEVLPDFGLEVVPSSAVAAAKEELR
ncbi:MAG: alanine--glyoxylate aminotransferase family protein [Actinomycetota bacterium]|nr:alanine--glyoxylate aminotransferase family protein [Actinomycetota bacterium]